MLKELDLDWAECEEISLPTCKGTDINTPKKGQNVVFGLLFSRRKQLRDEGLSLPRPKSNLHPWNEISAPDGRMTILAPKTK